MYKALTWVMTCLQTDHGMFRETQNCRGKKNCNCFFLSYLFDGNFVFPWHVYKNTGKWVMKELWHVTFGFTTLEMLMGDGLLTIHLTSLKQKSNLSHTHIPSGGSPHIYHLEVHPIWRFTPTYTIWRFTPFLKTDLTWKGDHIRLEDPPVRLIYILFDLM